MIKFLLQSTEITSTGSIDPHSIYVVFITKGKMYIHAMEYFKYDLSLPCSGLKVMTKSKTNFCLRPFVNPILSKQKKVLTL